MNEAVLRRAWAKIKEGKELSEEESKAIRTSEEAKAIKAGVIFV